MREHRRRIHQQAPAPTVSLLAETGQAREQALKAEPVLPSLQPSHSRQASPGAAPPAQASGSLLGQVPILPSGSSHPYAPDLPVERQTHVWIQPAIPRWNSGPKLPLQRQEDLGGQIAARLGQGIPLQPDVRATLEGGLRADLSDVQVHTDGEADRLARSVQAVAFTTGADIFFRQGAYTPGTPQGLHLLAHEATHTVQQSQGAVDGTPHPNGVSISDPGDRFERAADAAASRAAEGIGPAIQRKENRGSAGQEGHSAPVVVQRKLKLGKTYVSDMLSWKGMANDSTLNQLDNTYREYLKAPLEKEPELINRMLNLSADWIIAHQKDTGKTADEKFVRLDTFRDQLKAEQDRWYKSPHVRGNLDLVSQVGLPKDYIESMKAEDFARLMNAHLALGEGDMGKADTELGDLRKSIGDDVNLISSSLVRHHIGKVSPDLEEIINKPKYELKDKASRGLGKTRVEDLAAERLGQLKTFEGERTKAEEELELFSPHYTKRPTPGGTQYVFDAQIQEIWKKMGKGKGRLQDYIANLERQAERGKVEQQFFGAMYPDMAKAAESKQRAAESKSMKDLPPDEFMALVGYTAPLYADYNNPLRQESGKPSFNGNKLALTQLTVSGLNRLPAFDGMSYRHTGLIAGYSALTVVGAVVTDMAFFSTAKLVMACGNAGEKHDVLEIIHGKSGRDIGDVSMFGKREAEILFKPGTRFKVVERYDRDIGTRTWPKLPTDVETVLKEDSKKDQIKMIVVKQEV